jgi:hypothetical protein
MWDIQPTLPTSSPTQCHHANPAINIHEPLCLAMAFSSRLDTETCNFTLYTCVLPLSRWVEGIEASIVSSMSGSVVWCCGFEQCCYSTYEVKELKADVGDRKCKLEIKINQGFPN